MLAALDFLAQCATLRYRVNLDPDIFERPIQAIADREAIKRCGLDWGVIIHWVDYRSLDSN